MFRYLKLKVMFSFTVMGKERTSFDILSLKVNFEVNLFFILKTTFKLTQGRMLQIAFSKVHFPGSEISLNKGEKYNYLFRELYIVELF